MTLVAVMALISVSNANYAMRASNLCQQQQNLFLLKFLKSITFPITIGEPVCTWCAI
jgi:hypothetical protein